jgi:hypothetical protein
MKFAAYYGSFIYDIISYCFGSICYRCMCMLYMFLYAAVKFCKLYILLCLFSYWMLMYFYCYVCSVYSVPLCCVYRLCINVYCTAATECQTQMQLAKFIIRAGALLLMVRPLPPPKFCCFGFRNSSSRQLFWKWEPVCVMWWRVLNSKSSPKGGGGVPVSCAAKRGS